MTPNLSFILMAVAFVLTTLLYPFVLSFARRHNIVDNPSARKLQRVPVPVMGGTAVFLGLAATVILGLCIVPNPKVTRLLILLAVMYLIGTWDDIKDVSPSLRFIVELGVVWMMIVLIDVEINDFHGLWGIHGIPDAVSVPLSLIAGVGIMNAINLIDGVDGYCSSYGIMACTAFAIIFYIAGDIPMFTIALISIGALIPFFFHNVFGRTSKMFLGDGGSLMLGALLSLFVFRALTAGSLCSQHDYSGLSLVAMSLAILAVPVFDTLKVMIFRVIRGQSPFHPDKTHLHHLFIEMNYSHLATSGIIVFANILIIGVLLLIWWLGASITLQVYIVVLCAVFFTWGFYFFMERQRRQNDGEGTLLWRRSCVRGRRSHMSTTPVWSFLRNVVDSRFFGAGMMKENVDKEVPSQDKPKFDPRVER